LSGFALRHKPIPYNNKSCFCKPLQRYSNDKRENYPIMDIRKEMSEKNFWKEKCIALTPSSTRLWFKKYRMIGIFKETPL
jgi:hypothetical protein